MHTIVSLSIELYHDALSPLGFAGSVIMSMNYLAGRWVRKTERTLQARRQGLWS